MKILDRILAASLIAAASQAVAAAPVYLNSSNMTVQLGAGMAAEPFANRTTAASLASIIDAPSASAGEFHTQSTHVWVSGGTLSLRFDMLVEYDLKTLHFWNYHSEAYDVDNIDFSFFDATNNLVGTLNDVAPQLGNATGSDGTLIFAEDYALSFPSKVRYVNAVLSGSNSQVDFNNLGFTGELSDPNPNTVPEPTTLLLATAALGLLRLQTRRQT
jgi:hypothetical protein